MHECHYISQKIHQIKWHLQKYFSEHLKNKVSKYIFISYSIIVLYHLKASICAMLCLKTVLVCHFLN